MKRIQISIKTFYGSPFSPLPIPLHLHHDILPHSYIPPSYHSAPALHLQHPHPSPNNYRPASYLHHPIPHIAPPTLHLLHQDGVPPSLYGGTFTPPAAPPPFHTVITLLAHLPHPDIFPVLAHFPYATLSLPSDGGVALR